MRGALVATLLWLMASAPAWAASTGEDGFLADAAARAAAGVQLARRAIPEPFTLTWQKRHLGEASLTGPLLDLAVADITGDGRAEILALAPREAVALAKRDPGGLELIGRVSFDELAPAPIRPRHPVGTAAMVGTRAGIEWWARSSEHAEAAVIAWRGGKLVLLRREAGYPICAAEMIELEEGRNTFVPAHEDAAPLHAARCRQDLVGADGWPREVRAHVTIDGELSVTASRRCGGEDCGAEVSASAEGRGDAIALGDLDRDGEPEVAASARRPPGEPDEVAVWSLAGDGLSLRHEEAFAGPVAGIAIGDINGDGRGELVVAVRTPGRHRIELWTLT